MLKQIIPCAYGDLRVPFFPRESSCENKAQKNQACGAGFELITSPSRCSAEFCHLSSYCNTPRLITHESFSQLFKSTMSEKFIETINFCTPNYTTIFGMKTPQVAVIHNSPQNFQDCSSIAHCRNERGLGKSMVVFRLFEKLRYSNERPTKFESLCHEQKYLEEENGKIAALQISPKIESLYG